MLLSGLFFFRTFTPVFFWSNPEGKIEELSYFKMKSKLRIQLYIPIGIFLSVFFLRPKKRFFDSNHFSELQVVCGEQEKFQEDFILKSCFFYRFTTLQVHIVRKYKLEIISRKY